jgi:hypothetical protein
MEEETAGHERYSATESVEYASESRIGEIVIEKSGRR